MDPIFGLIFFHHQIFSPVRYLVFRCIAAGPAFQAEQRFQVQLPVLIRSGGSVHPTPRMAGLKFWFNWPRDPVISSGELGKWPEIKHGFAWGCYNHPYKYGLLDPYLQLVTGPTWLVILLYSVVRRKPHNKEYSLQRFRHVSISTS